MRSFLALFALIVGVTASAASAQPLASVGPYKVVKTVKVGGDGGFDYVYADVTGSPALRSSPWSRRGE